jgi:radical SAM protein with 4Fe4S-binding SPASM domain
MEKGLIGLANVNIELTNRCNKSCWMCGRRKVEKENSNFEQFYNKEIEFSLLKKIACELPPGIVVQLHNNGEPLLYSQFGNAVDLFKKQITNIVTNGKLLIEKNDEIINKLDSMSISVFENDVEAESQYEIIKEFLNLKKVEKPFTSLRLIGNVNQKKYKDLGCQIITRTLHSPMGSFSYRKSPTIPEIGICLDFLNHLAIDVNGNVSICVRFDPNMTGVIGNVKENTLEEIWNGQKRSDWKKLHVCGERSKIPLCSSCEFWGIPTGN